MTLISTPTWEQSLLSLAREARPFHAATAPAAITDPVLLARAYAHCEALTARHSRSFHLASRFLPSDKRRAIRALYAFCRVADNIVDRGQASAAAGMCQWVLDTRLGSLV